MTVYGYCRVSSKLQNLERQINSLNEYGVDEKNIFYDKLSGKDFNRPGYKKLKEVLKENDTIVFHELDRLGRNYDEGMEEVYLFRKMNIKLIFLNYLWLNTLTESADVILRANGYNLLALYLAIAETERRELKKRQSEGIAIAKKNNPDKYTGRKRKYKEVQIQDALDKYQTGEYTVKQAIAASGMSRATFYRRINIKK